MGHQFKLGRVVQLGFGSVFIIMLGIGVVSKLTLNQIVESNRWVTHTYQVQKHLEDILSLLIDAETGQRGYILTQETKFLEPYQSSKSEFEQQFQDISRLIQDNPQQVQRLTEVKRLASERMDGFENTIVLTQTGKRDEAIKIIQTAKGKALMDSIRNHLQEMIAVEDNLLKERQASAIKAAFWADLVSVGGTSSAILFGLLVLWFISREIVRPINQVASVIASSSSEIAATVEQQERTATQQATSVNETTTTMDELSASAQQSAQQAEIASASAQQVLSLADRGNRVVEQTLDSMAMLSNKVSATADQILQLSEQTNQIGSIAGLVSDLANQTNMLALNAAVEAVRAGEQGKGFAVVATEIRKLADQSKKSAEKINALVSDIQTAINTTVLATNESTRTAVQGTQITQQTAEVFSNVADAINNVVLNIQQISLNAKQQATAVQQVLEAMNSLNIAAQQTASGVSQTRVGTHQLNEAARRLQSVV